MRKIFIMLILCLGLIPLSVNATETSDIEGILQQAKYVGIINTPKTFKICLPSKNSRYLIRFKVKKSGEYIISSSSSKISYEARLLSRNFSYALVTDCTDFNFKNNKKSRLFNCKEQLENSKSYYIYFEPIGLKPSLGCFNITIKQAGQ